MFKYLVILICSIFIAGCDTPVANNDTKNEDRVDLTVYTTSKDTGQRLALAGSFEFKPRVQPTEGEVSIFVNSTKKFQKFLGVGGSFTDASAEVFSKLDNAKQEEFLKAYFDPEEGIGYSLSRTTIHSSDFGSSSHTYVEEGDKDLDTFSVEKDKQYRIPMIKRAIEAAGGELMLYASPWSAPAFMKSNNNMLRGGKLLPEYYDSWAKYYTKFIEAYEQEGMPIWGISIQNEPMAVQRWESMIYTAEEERDFLKNHLGPTMHKAGYEDKKIIVWDHNRDLIVERANIIFDDPEAAKYAWGIGYHWYETWYRGDDCYPHCKGHENRNENIGLVYNSYPDKHILFTEGTIEAFSPDKYQYWPNAERYGREMIRDFNRGTVGWTDWNLLLDHTGGPNHVSNFCFAPIHADTRTGELIYTPTYYYIGHFSKFIRPDAERISTSSSRSLLLATSFLNEDNQITTVVMNETDEAIDYHLFADMQQVTLSIPAHSMQTLVY